MKHLNIKWTFTTELFANDKPLFVGKMTKFNWTYAHPHHRIGKLLLNLYGTKNPWYIYMEGLDAHLQSHGYTPSEADPFLYHKEVPNGLILIATTVDDFLITASTDKDIEAFKTYFYPSTESTTTVNPLLSRIDGPTEL